MRDADALNDREALSDTPIGDCVVERWGEQTGVGVVNRHNPEKRPRLIHVVDARRGVWDAFYGKQHFAGEEVLAAYDRYKERVSTSNERKSALISADMRRGLERLLNRSDDARDVMLFGRRQ